MRGGGALLVVVVAASCVTPQPTGAPILPALPSCRSADEIAVRDAGVDAWPELAPGHPPPTIARSLAMLGRHVVGLHVGVDAAGAPTCARVTRPSGFKPFDDAALALAPSWRFTPAQRGGAAIPAWAHLVVRGYTDGDDAACADGLTWACLVGGQAAWAARDIDGAERMLQRGCDRGELGACAELGVLLRQERGDGARGASFLEHACDRHGTAACVRLGYAYERGLGVPQDLARAVTAYDRACLGRNGHGCNNLAILYWRGNGVTQDRERAVALFDEGCGLGSAGACTSLGWRLVDGDGVARDEPRGQALLERACRDGEGAACVMLGEGRENAGDFRGAIAPHLRACGLEPVRCSLPELEAAGRIPPDAPAAARGWGSRALAARREACAKDDPRDEIACQLAAKQLRCGFSVGRDLHEAERLARRGCDDTVRRPEACRELALVVLELGRPADARTLLAGACDGSSSSACARLADLVRAEDPTRAAGLDAQACDRGEGSSCAELARWLVTTDRTRAAELALRACDDHSTAGCALAAELTDRDDDVAAQARAATFLRRACDLEHRASCTALAERYRVGRGVAVLPEKAAALLRRAAELPERGACGIPVQRQ